MPSDRILIAVAGAHLSGEPLNHQLTDRGARLVRKTKTAPSYQLFALPGTSPPKPGLVRVGCETSRSIDVEVWDMPLSGFGGFIDEIPPPLTIGTVHTEYLRVRRLEGVFEELNDFGRMEGAGSDGLRAIRLLKQRISGGKALMCV
jgi:hypothetical protein